MALLLRFCSVLPSSQDAGVHAGIIGKAFDEGGILGCGVVHEFHDVDPLVES